MEIKIFRMAKMTKESNLKAFVDVLFDEKILVKGFKVLEGRTGLYVAPPAEKTKTGEYYDVVRFNTLEFQKEVESYIIQKYKEE